MPSGIPEDSIKLKVKSIFAKAHENELFFFLGNPYLCQLNFYYV